MENLNRRRFIQVTTAASASGLLAGIPTNAADQHMRLGLIVGVQRDADKALKLVHDLGIPTCQAQTDDYSDRVHGSLKAAIEKYGIEVTAVNSSGGPPNVYDFYQGPLTIGVVPKKYRRQRIDNFKRASDFAKKLGVPAFHTHYGFIPENPNDSEYSGVVEALREVAAHLKGNGQMMLYETGQESPVTMLRAITDVGVDNQFVNLDTANLILYGKGNPLDALDVVGRLVRGVHAKDGLFPTDPKRLGEEVPIGQGKANFPKLIPRLKELGYTGAITIEREISGPKQIEDIKKEKVYLEKLIG
ncbi:MAG TPA: sugar phosphate isomerase/epimerase family protein [Terriglobia bacterium]|nr:sugar phosphate isomerase/epimerase family protein [Terriglobia bacterium]